MTEQNSPAARYATLRDYIAVLRRYWWLIGIIALIGAGAGAADALRKKAVYQANVEVAFQDPTKDLSLVGIPANAVVTPVQVAALNETTATTPAVMTQVKRQLRTPLSVPALTGEIGTSVNVGSGLLLITASASNPTFAARLANTLGNVLVAQDNRQARAQFAQVADHLRRRIAALRPLPGGAPNPQLSFYEDELARLNTLAGFATAAQIANPAEPPSGPSSPHKAREAVIGGVLGLLLGLIAAFVRDSMDRRLRKPSDFESAFELPVIGHVRKQSLGRVAYASNGAGAVDRLDLESFRILRRNVEFLDPERAPKVVLVTSAVAEEGKTTVASSLAFVLAAAGKKALLVDCDLRRPDLAGRVKVELSPGLSEYLAGVASTEEISRTVTFSETSLAAGKASKNGAGKTADPDSLETGSEKAGLGPLVHELACVPAGTVTSRGSELLGTSRFQEFLEHASASYAVVVLDSSPLLPVADTLEILPHVDSIVICARQSRTTRDQARAVKAALARFPPRPTGVVVTGIKPRGAEYEVYAYSYSYG
jgi:polysaccharide biosynthesis transport protein